MIYENNDEDIRIELSICYNHISKNRGFKVLVETVVSSRKYKNMANYYIGAVFIFHFYVLEIKSNRFEAFSGNYLTIIRYVVYSKIPTTLFAHKSCRRQVSKRTPKTSVFTKSDH